MKWFPVLVALAVALSAAKPSSSTPRSTALSVSGLCVRVRVGWHGRVVRLPLSAPALNLANFALPPAEYLYGNTAAVRWPRGGTLLTVIDWRRRSSSSERMQFRPATLPLTVRQSDFAPFEGARDLGRRSVRVRDHLLEAWVQVRPRTARTLRRANEELARVRLCARRA